MRLSKFPAPYLNCSLFLMKRLNNILDELYFGESKHVAKDGYGKQIHYKASK